MINIDHFVPQQRRVDPARSETAPMRRNHKLTTEQKEHVVQRLAGFETPGAIAQDLWEQCGVMISRNAIERYDPTRWRKCPERWKRLFFATRRAIIEDKAAAGAAMWRSRRRSRERILLRSVEALANRILHGVDQGGGLGQPQPQMSDRESAQVLLDFINRMKAATGTSSLAEAVAHEQSKHLPPKHQPPGEEE
jgi:hypothetical protein